MKGLHNCNVPRSSLHRITCEDVSCFMVSTSPWFILIDCDTFTDDSSVCPHLHGCVWVCIIFWRAEKIWILRVGKIINIFSFMWMRRRNFYFFFIRISVVVWINFLSPRSSNMCAWCLVGFIQQESKRERETLTLSLHNKQMF
jgi:hypothetical protein